MFRGGGLRLAPSLMELPDGIGQPALKLHAYST
jgi:hypothetical protein